MALRFLSPLHKASRQITLDLEKSCDGWGVSPGEAHLLSYLNLYAPCPIAEILRVFGHKPSTMTSMLERLADHGLIRRDTDPDDRRSVLVTLTGKGKKLAARINAAVKNLEDRIAKHTNERAIAGFQAVMEAIAQATQIQVRKERVK
jgi:MarR family transcriptional regulator, organic hydroperoxide resistance regulator